MSHVCVTSHVFVTLHSFVTLHVFVTSHVFIIQLCDVTCMCDTNVYVWHKFVCVMQTHMCDANPYVWHKCVCVTQLCMCEANNGWHKCVCVKQMWMCDVIQMCDANVWRHKCVTSRKCVEQWLPTTVPRNISVQWGDPKCSANILNCVLTCNIIIKNIVDNIQSFLYQTNFYQLTDIKEPKLNPKCFFLFNSKQIKYFFDDFGVQQYIFFMT